MQQKEPAQHPDLAGYEGPHRLRALFILTCVFYTIWYNLTVFLENLMLRRQFLGAGLGLFVGAILPSFSSAAPAKAQSEFTPPSFDLSKGVRSVDWYRPATKERLTLDYMQEGVWVPGAYDQLCMLLRDVQANKAIQMDTRLIAILDWTQLYLRQYGYTSPIHILSGYRTAATNNRLENASRRSQHLVGKAVDIRVPGVSTEYLGKLFKWLSLGGVGVYGNTNFVHLDTGKVREWRG